MLFSSRLASTFVPLSQFYNSSFSYPFVSFLMLQSYFLSSSFISYPTVSFLILLLHFLSYCFVSYPPVLFLILLFLFLSYCYNQSDRFSVASIYAPITFHPSPVLVFKRTPLPVPEGGSLFPGQRQEYKMTLVGTGSLGGVDPDRIILKKVW